MENKWWYVHILEYHAAMKRSKPTHTTTWMSLKCMMLCDSSQLRRLHACSFISMELSRKSKSMGAENSFVAARA